MPDVFPSVSILIPKLKSGNAVAWDELCDKFRMGLVGKARQMIRASNIERRYTPEDLIQEAFMKAWKRHSTFRGKTTSQLAKWLLTILKNTFRDWSRQVKPEAIIPTWFEFEGQDETPSKHLISDEQEAEMLSCLAEISPKYQEVLVFRHFDGLKFSEIAIKLDMNLNTVAGNYRRGLEQLAKALNEFE